MIVNTSLAVVKRGFPLSFGQENVTFTYSKKLNFSLKVCPKEPMFLGEISPDTSNVSPSTSSMNVVDLFTQFTGTRAI